MKDNNLRDQYQSVFEEYLRNTRRRRTPERTAVLDCALTFKGRFTSDEVFARLSDGSTPVARSSVYNNLSLMVLAGMLLRLEQPGRGTCYEFPRKGRNGHVMLVCDRCNKVREIPAADVADIIGRMHYPSFHAKNFVLTVHGICKRCAPGTRTTTNTTKTVNTYKNKS